MPRDAAAAAAWYLRAAEQGNAEAQLAIAGLYYQGEGVPRNYTTALQWFRAAASQGSATAQAAIAVMYERGLGVRRDPVVAHAWLSVAADSGRRRRATPPVGFRDRSVERTTGRGRAGEAPLGRGAARRPVSQRRRRDAGRRSRSALATSVEAPAAAKLDRVSKSPQARRPDASPRRAPSACRSQCRRRRSIAPGATRRSSRARAPRRVRLSRVSRFGAEDGAKRLGVEEPLDDRARQRVRLVRETRRDRRADARESRRLLARSRDTGRVFRSQRAP